MPSTPSPAPEVQTLLTGLAFSNSPRWHTGRLWFADWRKQEVVAVDLDQTALTPVRPSYPISAQMTDIIGAVYLNVESIGIIELERFL